MLTAVSAAGTTLAQSWSLNLKSHMKIGTQSFIFLELFWRRLENGLSLKNSFCAFFSCTQCMISGISFFQVYSLRSSFHGAILEFWKHLQ
jgi:hypothetical protein